MDSNLSSNDIIQLYSIIFGCLSKVNETLEEVHNNPKKIHIFYKEQNQRFTQYDYCIQKMFEGALTLSFNQGIKIIGEEKTSQSIDQEYDLKVVFNDEEWKKSTFGDSINIQLSSLITIEDNKTLNINDLTIFIDPIDATNEFIKGNNNPVTVLIGICYKNNPFIGFIHHPKITQKITYFNIPSKGVYVLDYNLGQIEKLEIKLKPIDRWDFLISSSKPEEEMFQAIDLFEKSSIIQIGGTGNKVVEAIKNDDFYLSTNGKLSLWDVCAGDCIGREINQEYCGFFYLNGNRIDYSTKNLELNSTVIFTINDKRAECFIKTIAQNKLYIKNTSL